MVSIDQELNGRGMRTFRGAIACAPITFMGGKLVIAVVALLAPILKSSWTTIHRDKTVMHMTEV
jgi:hypothetical protein